MSARQARGSPCLTDITLLARGTGVDLQAYKQSAASCALQVDNEQWNACAIGAGVVNPFLLWEFFHCLEESGSAVRLL